MHAEVDVEELVLVEVEPRGLGMMDREVEVLPTRYFSHIHSTSVSRTIRIYELERT